MKHRKSTLPGVWVFSTVLLFAGGDVLHASDTNTESQLQLLRQQNDSMQTQLQQQRELIDALRHEVSEIRQMDSRQGTQVNDLKSGQDDTVASASSGPSFGFGKVRISGEGGAGIFESGSRGQFPNAEFRVDEARLFVDAPVWGDVYAYAELNLITRESYDADLELGEVYLDAEDISRLWGKDGQLNLRIGQLYIPFGEEYLARYAIDNPLISHSLSDVWGVDEGVEFYGSFGKFCYAAAVQNGGISTLRDFNADKSVAGRVSFDPKRWLHLSVSGMRTGDLDVRNDGMSALWFGNGWFRSLGSPATTDFRANLVEGDVEVRLPRGHVEAFGGYIRYSDNDPAAKNGRDVYYYSVEAVQDLAGKLYGAARFSQIFAQHGFPIVGNGDMNDYLFGPLVEDMWRLSLGLGYRWNQHLLLKTEYSFEQGKAVDGSKRNHEDLFATEAAFGF